MSCSTVTSGPLVFLVPIEKVVGKVYSGGAPSALGILLVQLGGVVKSLDSMMPLLSLGWSASSDKFQLYNNGCYTITLCMYIQVYTPYKAG